MRDNWDNGESARIRLPGGRPRPDSAESCADACEVSDQCVQWLWRGLDAKECILMRQIRLGVPREPEIIPEPEPEPEGKDGDEEPEDRPIKPKPKPKERKISFKSGWMTERIERWRNEKKCKNIQWVGPSITRIY